MGVIQPIMPMIFKTFQGNYFLMVAEDFTMPKPSVSSNDFKLFKVAKYFLSFQELSHILNDENITHKLNGILTLVINIFIIRVIFRGSNLRSMLPLSKSSSTKIFIISFGKASSTQTISRFSIQTFFMMFWRLTVLSIISKYLRHSGRARCTDLMWTGKVAAVIDP